MTNAKAYQGFHDNKKVEEPCLELKPLKFWLWSRIFISKTI